MKPIRTIYLFKFLEKNYSFFTSLAFFAVLLTITLSINKTESSQINNMILVLQSTSLILFILCLFPLQKKIKESKARITQIFGLLVLFLMMGFMGYLWYGYRQIISGIVNIIFIVVGFIHSGEIGEYIKQITKDGREVIKKHVFTLFIFILIVFVNLVLIYQGRWMFKFDEIVDWNILYGNGFNLVFIGYCVAFILWVIGWIWNFIIKGGKKIFQMFV